MEKARDRPRPRREIARLVLAEDEEVVAISPRARWVLSRRGRQLRLREVGREQPARSLGEVRSPAYAAATFSPRGRRLVVTSIDEKRPQRLAGIWLYDLRRSGRPRRLRYPGQPDLPGRLVFSPDGEKVAAFFSSSLWIWSARGRARRCRGYAPTTEMDAQGYAPSFSADGRSVVAGGWTGPVPVARLPGCEPRLRLFPETAKGERGDRAPARAPARYWAFEARFSPDGRFVVGLSGTLQGFIWSAETGKRLHPLSAPIPKNRGKWHAEIHFSVDGRLVRGRNPAVTGVWDLRSGASVAPARAAGRFADSYAAVKTVWFSEAGLYWATRDGSRLVLWRGVNRGARRRR